MSKTKPYRLALRKADKVFSDELCLHESTMLTHDGSECADCHSPLPVKLTKSEKECKDMADVCELAHERTVWECKQSKVEVNCKSQNDCGDDGQEHEGDPEWDGNFTHYSKQAQEIFDRHYEYICEVTGI